MDKIFKSGATGILSSKRIFGVLFLLIGGGLKIFGCYASVKYKFADPELFETCSNALIYVGGGLLGFGVLDGLGKKIGGN